LIYSAFIVYYDCSILEIIWQNISDGDRNAYSEAYGIQVAEKVLAVTVPGDIAIVGFNDDVISRMIQAKISTVQYNGREMGKAAARSLLEQLNNNSTGMSDYVTILRHKLIVRASSQKSLIS
jgi:LacI family transcriptional regulator